MVNWPTLLFTVQPIFLECLLITIKTFLCHLLLRMSNKDTVYICNFILISKWWLLPGNIDSRLRFWIVGPWGTLDRFKSTHSFYAVRGHDEPLKDQIYRPISLIVFLEDLPIQNLNIESDASDQRSMAWSSLDNQLILTVILCLRHSALALFTTFSLRIGCTNFHDIKHNISCSLLFCKWFLQIRHKTYHGVT